MKRTLENILAWTLALGVTLFTVACWVVSFLAPFVILYIIWHFASKYW